MEVKLVNHRGEIVPIGDIGEVCIKGPQVFTGYLKDPQSTMEAFDSEGWFHTGDFALFDNDMYLQIKGRKRDIVLSRRGHHIFMSEIESFLNTHPDISMVVAFGLPDGAGAENVHTWIKMKPGRPAVTLESIREFGKTRVAEYKIPDFVRIVESFPLNFVGKVNKTLIRQQEMALTR